MTLETHVRMLTQLGLTSYEARAYLALLEAEPLTAATVARTARLPRQRIYDVLEALDAKGMVVVKRGRPVRYEGVAPAAAVELLLNGLRADLEKLIALGRTLASDLGPLYESARTGLASDCAAVLLAAGNGQRFGGRKLLATLDGRPLLQHVLDAAAMAGLDPVVVVLGTDAAALRQACSWRDEVVVVNPDPEAGLSGSVKLGLAQLAPSPARRALMLLGDQPRLSAGQLRTILDTPADDARPIVVPRYSGRSGSPALLERAAWPLAAALEGDQGMSQLFQARRRSVRYVDVDGENPDVDTPADLGRLGA